MSERIEPYKDRFVLYQNFSDNVVNNFEDNSLDFIFIDGLHTYDQVLKDCRNYYPKIKSGGLFAGHYFNAIAEVNKAVKEFANECSVDSILETEVDVWFWYKP